MAAQPSHVSHWRAGDDRHVCFVVGDGADTTIRIARRGAVVADSFSVAMSVLIALNTAHVGLSTCVAIAVGNHLGADQPRLRHGSVSVQY